MSQHLWGNPLSSYIVFISIIVGSFIAARVARVVVYHYAARWAEKTDSKWDDVIIHAVMGPATWLVAVGGAVLGKEGLILSERAELWTNRTLAVCAILVLYTAMFKLFRGGSELLVEEYMRRTSKSLTEEEKAAEEKASARLTKQINEVAGMVIILLALLTVLSNLGVDLKAIWASLGIGGIALALAVKEPMANIVGRMMIFSTGLFDEGHMIEIDNWKGTVTRIGTFRTSLELIGDMSTVTIPNVEFIKKPVKNTYGRKKFIFKWDLDVPYDVDAATIEKLILELRMLLSAKPEILPDFSFVYLDRLDKYSKVVRVWFQVRLPDFPAYTNFGTATLSEIQKLFACMGIEFAYPTYSLSIDSNKKGEEMGKKLF